MPEKNITEVGTITLDGEEYRLVRTDEYKQEWRQASADEPPWEGGLPHMLSLTEESWHLGGFKSKQGIPGTTEYGNTDCRWPFQMLPPPHVTTLTLPSSASTPTSIFECLDYIFVVAGRRVFRINPSTFEVTLSKDFGSGDHRIMGLRWTDEYNDEIGLVTGRDEPDNAQGAYAPTWKVTTIGTPDTWTSGSVANRFLASGINRLFLLGFEGYLANISVGLDPLATTSVADMVQCGEPNVWPRGLVAFENTALAGKPDGLFGVSVDEATGVPLIKRMVRDADNCLGMCVVEPYAFVPHSRGLYRVRPGVSVESIGLEREVLAELDLTKGRFRAFAVDNQWIYACLEGPSGVSSYILVGRARGGEEPGLGPIIWDTLIDLGAAVSTRAMCISVQTAQPTLFFGNGNNVSYIKLPVGGGVPDSSCSFNTSGVRYSPKYHFDDWNSKDFPKFKAAVRGASATRYWSIAYEVDGGGWVTTDINSVAMAIKSAGVKTFYLATSAVGREIQFRFTYTGPAADTAPVPLVYFKPYAVPQSQKVPVIKVILHLAAGIRHDMSKEGRNAITQYTDLDALSRQAASVVSSGPWGEDVSVWVRYVQLLQTVQEGIGEPELLVEVTLQKREAA